ncbi:aspartate-semialdehyde dehydrogenase [Candidatus Omnitrophota bacterium]
MKKYNVAVVGVGAVGEEMLRVLAQRNFPIKELRVFARSARDITVDDQVYSVQQINSDGFDGIDIALFAGTEGEKGAAVTFAPDAVRSGAVVIDNGADFRMKPDVPLVVPEANPQDAKKHKGIIANPNCSTIQMIVAINPIYKQSGISRIIVSSYQAASGAGRGAVKQLHDECRAWAQNEPIASPTSLSQNIAFNIIPHIGGFSEDDYTSEEWKMVKETHKIMHDDKIKISATTVRVPVKTGHCEAVYLETDKPITPEEVKKVLSSAPGIGVVDNIKNNVYPMPIDCEGKDEVFVGRIRRDPFVKNGLWLWVVSDNLRKGAALNAIQIAEEVIK